MKYYLSIGEVIVQVDCPDNLYLIDDWKIFFDDWLKSFFVPEKKADVFVVFGGLITKGSLVVKDEEIRFPKVVDNKLYFDNLLHSSMFLHYLELLISPVLLKKNGIFVHAGAFLKQKKVILVTGDCGSGKSTLLSNVCLKYDILSEDSLIMKIDDGENLSIFPSPMNFKKKIQIANKAYELKRALMIDKNKSLYAKQIDEQKSFSLILDQVRLRVNSRDKIKLAMRISKKIANNFFILGYKNGRDDVLGFIDKMDNEKN